MSLVDAINLQTELKLHLNNDWPRPLNFHQRTQHVPKSPLNLQKELDKLCDYSKIFDMKINEGKTKVMMFNKSNKYDFVPQLSVREDGVLLK